MKKILFILLFVQSNAIGQKYFHYDLNVENGLPSNTVYDMHLSQEGFLFVGTSRGVVRYDGKKMEELITGDYKIPITGFEEDAYGHIFFLTFGGGIWECGPDSVKRIRGMHDLAFPTMSMLNKKELIVSSTNGYYAYNSRRKQLTKHLLPVENNSEPAQSEIMAQVANGVIIKLKDALFRIDNEHKVYPIYSTIEAARFKFCIQWGDRTVLIGRPESGNSAAVSLYEIGADTVRAIRICSQMQLLDLLGVECYDTTLYLLTRKGYKYLAEPMAALKEAGNFTKRSISKIIKDGQHGLYISTLTDGVKLMPNTRVKVAGGFKPYKSVKNLLVQDDHIYYTAEDNVCHTLYPKGIIANMPLDPYVEAKLQSDGNLFFNSPNRKYLYNTQLKKVKPLYLNYAITELSYFPKEKKAILSSRRNLSIMYEDFVDFKNAKKRYKKVIDKIGLRSVFTNRKEKLGVIILMNEGSSFHYYDVQDSSLYASVDDKYYHIYPDGRKKLLRNRSGPIDAAEIVPSTSGVFYLNTRKGICKLVNDSVVSTLGYESGLIESNWKRIKTQGDTLLLIGDHSIQIYSERTGSIVTYSTHDFLPTSALLDVVIYKGKLFVSTTKGVYELPLDRIEKNLPRAFIRYLQAGETRWSEQKNMPYAKNNLTFIVAGNSIINRGAFHYEYNLQGTGSDKWVHQDARIGTIRFSALTEGRYKLRLKVVTYDGMESRVVEYPFTINPPFTRSYLFYFLCILLILGVLGLIFWLRVRSLRRTSAFDKQVKQSEITAIKAQMNPHFVFNALNAIQNWVLLNDVENSNKYLGKFSDLVRKTLEASEKSEVALIKELEIITLYLDLEKLRFGEEIEIKFDVNINKEDLELMAIPAMLIQPYIENVFKHGLLHKKGRKELNILIEIRNEKLFCQIEDNGVGRARSQELNKRNKKYKSFSTTANRKRIDLLNDMFDNEIELKIEDAFPSLDDCGTRVTICLPVSNN